MGFVSLLSWKLQVAQFENPNFRLEIDPAQNEQMPGSAFFDRTMLKPYDLIILFIVNKGMYRPSVRELSGTLDQSGKIAQIGESLSKRQSGVEFFSSLRSKEGPCIPYAFELVLPCGLTLCETGSSVDIPGYRTL